MKRILLILLILAVGCLKATPPSEVEERLNGTEIQARFEEAFFSLKGSLDSGDIGRAKGSYTEMREMYRLAIDVVGKGHLEYFVLEEELELLGRYLEAGELESAEDILPEIGGGCGVKFCHARVGSSMAMLEVEYGMIKDALEEGDLEKAREHFPGFKGYWQETKGNLSLVMPRATKALMRDSYLDALEEGLASGNVSEAREAMEVISNFTCSFMGCHRIFFTNRTVWKF
jgi:hypothetical protein